MKKLIFKNESIKIEVNEDIINGLELIDLYDLSYCVEGVENIETIEDYESELIENIYYMADSLTPVYNWEINEKFDELDDEDIKEVINEFGYNFEEDFDSMIDFKQYILNRHYTIRLHSEVLEVIDSLIVDDYNESDFEELKYIILNYLKSYRGGFITGLIMDIKNGDDVQESVESVIQCIVEYYAEDDYSLYRAYKFLKNKLYKDEELYRAMLKYEL